MATNLIQPAGYSGTPLLKKLGIKEGMSVVVLNAPTGYFESVLGPLPEAVVLVDQLVSELDFIHYFCLRADDLERDFPKLMAAIKKTGMVWISWPKKASKMVTDVSENLIRDMGLAIGLVDVKVCAVDENWSGLKFVYRTKDR
jgi:hypothetical protein